MRKRVRSDLTGCDVNWSSDDAAGFFKEGQWEEGNGPESPSGPSSC